MRNICYILKRIFNEIINVIYPKRCPVCDEILSRQGSLCCNDCIAKLRYITEPLCKKCGKQLDDEYEEYCFDCNKKNKVFTEGRGVFLYDTYIKNSIIGFKYKGKKEYAQFYANEIVKNLGDYIMNLNIDIIIPVPIHKDRFNKRGYNQAEIIAKLVGKSLGIEVCSDILIRKNNTIAQKELDNIGRRKNLNNAFEINRNKYKEDKLFFINNILIIDDIYTTGATINACSCVLKKYIKNNVYYVALAIGQGK